MAKYEEIGDYEITINLPFVAKKDLDSIREYLIKFLDDENIEYSLHTKKVGEWL